MSNTSSSSSSSSSSMSSSTSTSNNTSSRGRTAEYDLIIIGAGLSGLSAASYYHEYSSRSKIIVLEGRSRVGGRTYSTNEYGSKSNGYEPHTLDLGGAYIGPSQNRILRLAKRFHVKTKKVYNEGKTVMYMNKKRYEYNGTIPSLSPLALLDLNHLMVDTETKRRSIDITQPWNHPHADVWDNMTVQDYIDAKSYTDIAKKIYSGATKGLLCVEANTVSLLSWLFYIQSGECINRITETSNGA